jgi:hypothetical protein
VGPIVAREALEGLRYKYTEMLRMRRVRQAEAEARPRMAELANRFPGALRELDDLELGEIERRVAALDVALGNSALIERWMEAIALFHARARGALSAKRWLDGRKAVDGAVAEAFSKAVGELPFPEDARAWQANLECIASPPGGRVTSAVLARVARELGMTVSEARVLVFGVPRRERRAAERRVNRERRREGG